MTNPVFYPEAQELDRRSRRALERREKKPKKHRKKLIRRLLATMLGAKTTSWMFRP